MVTLNKGEKVSLTKGRPSLSKLKVGLGWDVNRYEGEEEFDLDVSAFVLKSNGRVGSDADLIFYNNVKHYSGCVIHGGDNRTGDGDGDDEIIQVDLSKIPEGYEKIAVVVTIYDAENRLQNFGMVSNSYIRIVDETNGEQILRYELGEESSSQTALVFGEIYKFKNEWDFKAIGAGFNGGLEKMCQAYGINV